MHLCLLTEVCGEEGPGHAGWVGLLPVLEQVTGCQFESELEGGIETDHVLTDLYLCATLRWAMAQHEVLISQYVHEPCLRVSVSA